MPLATRGSQKHIQMYVNKRPDLLNDLIFSGSIDLCSSASGPIEWVSPLADNNYCEYRDEEFLKVLGLRDRIVELGRFWPSNGPSWDGLGKVTTQTGPGAVLIEVKAHLREAPYPDCCGATDPGSMELINRSLAKARLFYGISPDIAPWTESYYQVCNRLAHLYWMNEIIQIPCWLIWMFITDDPNWEDRASALEWLQYLEKVYKEIGMPREHRLKERIVTIFAPPLK